MLADWSVAMSSEDDDPIVTIPWTKDKTSYDFIDLTASPESITTIPEAIAHPALAAVLRAWNKTPSPWRTLKCDAFTPDDDFLDSLSLDLDLDAAASTHGFASYIDVALKAPQLFSSFSWHQGLLRALTDSAATIELDNASAEFVLRRCQILSSATDGFCISIYTNAVGPVQESAYKNWSNALTALEQPLLHSALQAAKQPPPPAS